MLVALRLVIGNVDREVAVSPIDLPVEVADEVYQGEEPQGEDGGRAIAFVSEGRLFVTEHDEGIVFTLEPAQGDTPPLVMAIARDLSPELGATHSASVALTSLRADDPH